MAIGTLYPIALWGLTSLWCLRQGEAQRRLQAGDPGRPWQRVRLSRHVRAYQCRGALDVSRPDKPTDNAFIESLNGRVRAGYLDALWFMSLDDAGRKCETWRSDHNEVRPHNSIGNTPPMGLTDRSAAHGPRRSRYGRKTPLGWSKVG